MRKLVSCVVALVILGELGSTCLMVLRTEVMAAAMTCVSVAVEQSGLFVGSMLSSVEGWDDEVGLSSSTECAIAWRSEREGLRSMVAR